MDTIATPRAYGSFFESEFISNSFFLLSRSKEAVDPFSSSFGAFNSKESSSLGHFNYADSTFQIPDYSQTQSNSSASSTDFTLLSELSDLSSLQSSQADIMDFTTAFLEPRFSPLQQQAEPMCSSPEQYPAFKAEIERSLRRKKSSVRRNVVQRFQTDASTFITPAMTETLPVTEFENWANLESFNEDLIPQLKTREDSSLSQGQTTCSESLISVNISSPPKQTSGEDVKSSGAAEKQEDEAPKPIIKRRRKRKQKSPEELEIKRKASLSRNRAAASKCRGRKKQWMHQLEDDLKTHVRVNEELKRQHYGLTEEIKMLKLAMSVCDAEDQGGGVVKKGDDTETNDWAISLLD